MKHVLYSGKKMLGDFAKWHEDNKLYEQDCVIVTSNWYFFRLNTYSKKNPYAKEFKDFITFRGTPIKFVPPSKFKHFK